MNVTNMGDDTPLHLAAAHNHRSVMKLLIDTRAVVDAVNEHGNTPLHYTCFWNYQDASEVSRFILLFQIKIINIEIFHVLDYILLVVNYFEYKMHFT